MNLLEPVCAGDTVDNKCHQLEVSSHSYLRIASLGTLWQYL